MTISAAAPSAIAKTRFLFMFLPLVFVAEGASISDPSRVSKRDDRTSSCVAQLARKFDRIDSPVWPTRGTAVSDAVLSTLDDYHARYEGRDVEGVTDLCLWPFVAIREGEPIHLPDRDAVRDHFAGAMISYRISGFIKWTQVERDVHELGTTRCSQPFTGLRHMPTANYF